MRELLKLKPITCVVALCVSLNCFSQSASKYGKYDISRLTPSVEYCGLKMENDRISIEIWNKYTIVDLTYIDDAKQDIAKLIYDNYEAKMPGILNFYVGRYANVTSSTIVRNRIPFLDDLIKDYSDWKKNESLKKIIANKKQEQKRKAQMSAEQLLYAALMARIITSMYTSGSSNGQYQCNGLYFNNEADMEDYKNANGLK